MIKNISLLLFRNHKEFSHRCDSKFVIITGPNGIGKTSILEAISLIAPDRGGMKGANMEEVLCNSQNEFNAWNIKVVLGDDEISTGFSLVDSKSRNMLLNNTKFSKKSEILQYLRVIWLTPQMGNILIESPTSRRKFFDRICYNIFPHHAHNVLQYERCMRSRMKILEQQYDDIWLSSIEEEMADLTILISKTRNITLERILHELKVISSKYLSPNIFLINDLYNFTKQNIIEILYQNRKLDLKAGRTLFGPHKTDIGLVSSKSGQHMKCCSTSEVKSMLIALIISHVNAIDDTCHKVLLLDELFNHLDNDAKTQLLKELEKIDAQIFITDTAIISEITQKHIYIKLGEI